MLLVTLDGPGYTSARTYVVSPRPAGAPAPALASTSAPPAARRGDRLVLAPGGTGRDLAPEAGGDAGGRQRVIAHEAAMSEARARIAQLEAIQADLLRLIALRERTIADATAALGRLASPPAPSSPGSSMPPASGALPARVTLIAAMLSAGSPGQPCTCTQLAASASRTCGSIPGPIASRPVAGHVRRSRAATSMTVLASSCRSMKASAGGPSMWTTVKTAFEEGPSGLRRRRVRPRPSTSPAAPSCPACRAR
jgi:hypothetical protein